MQIDVNQNAICTKILNDLFKLRNSKDGKKIHLFINNKRVSTSTVEEAAVKIYTECQTNFVANSDYQELVVKPLLLVARDTNKDFKDVCIAVFSQIISDYLYNKREIRDSHIQDSLPSAFKAEFIACTYKPSRMINSVDIELLGDLVICSKNNMLYYKRNNGYVLIGAIQDLIARTDSSMFKLVKTLTEYNAIRSGYAQYDLWYDMYKRADKATASFFECRRQCETAAKDNTKPSETDLYITVLDKHVKADEFLHISDWDDTWYDSLHSAFAKMIVNEVLPAMMLNADLANLYYETSDDMFKRYAFKQTHGKKCSFATYLSNLFTESESIVPLLKTIDVIPRIISDTDTCAAQFYAHTDWQDTLSNQLSIADSKILNTFLAPYTDVEKTALMAFAYTVWHPSLNDNVNLLFRTGGGAFKSNYYAEMISTIMNLMYKPNNSIIHILTGSSWVSDAALKENCDGTGISTAALVINDEATDQCIDEFKNMSGGSADSGVNYTRRVMRENPTTIKIYCKWMFLTNNKFVITDDSGALDRRLFIVDRPDVANLDKPYDTRVYNSMLVKEISAFYSYAKQCYTLVESKYGSLSSFVLKDYRIFKNLHAAYKDEDKTCAYSELYNELLQMSKQQNNTDVVDKSEYLAVKTEVLNTYVERYCNKYELNSKGFKNWILTTDKCTSKNQYTSIRVKQTLSKMWKLYALTDAALNEVVEETPTVMIEV